MHLLSMCVIVCARDAISSVYSNDRCDVWMRQISTVCVCEHVSMCASEVRARTQLSI